MSGFQALVRVSSLPKVVRCCNWYPEVRVLHGFVKTLEVAPIGDCIVRTDFHSQSLLRCGLNTVRICAAAAGSKRVETAFQRLTTCERQERIGAIRYTTLKFRRQNFAVSINSSINTQELHQRHSSCSRGDCNHMRSTQFRELDSKCSYPPGSALNNDAFFSFNLQRLVDALERR